MESPYFTGFTLTVHLYLTNYSCECEIIHIWHLESTIATHDRSAQCCAYSRLRFGRGVLARCASGRDLVQVIEAVQLRPQLLYLLLQGLDLSSTAGGHEIDIATTCRSSMDNSMSRNKKKKSCFRLYVHMSFISGPISH